MKREPDYTQLLKVLRNEVPDRPTLFEFFLNNDLYAELNNGEAPVRGDGYDAFRQMMFAFKNAGYDHITTHASDFGFPTSDHGHKATVSLNEGFVITDWASFEKYPWQDPKKSDYSRLDVCGKDLPPGMKFIVYGSNGVLENVIALVGYDNLCLMLYDDPELVQEIVDRVGSGLVGYYEQVAGHDNVCALISNDDWGFNTQTMLAPADMRKYIFPWHKKIAKVAHDHGKPVILHSCGMLTDVMDDIIDDMSFNAKHSFEDNIQPIESAYEQYKDRIALLGGLDLNFVCTASPEEVRKRAQGMMERSAVSGGYALGTGNSVPEYVPHENFYAMVDVVRKG